MNSALVAGTALLMLAGAAPTTAYHQAGAGGSLTTMESYVVGVADLGPPCESYGLNDPVNRAPTPHGGIDGLCYMSSNTGSCPPGAPTQTDPVPVDDCTFSFRPAGTFTTFNLAQSPGLPDLTGTRTGAVYFMAHAGGPGGLSSGADRDGACVSDNFSDI